MVPGGVLTVVSAPRDQRGVSEPDSSDTRKRAPGFDITYSVSFVDEDAEQPSSSGSTRAKAPFQANSLV